MTKNKISKIAVGLLLSVLTTNSAMAVEQKVYAVQIYETE